MSVKLLNFLILAVTVITVGSCTLTGEQEKSLNSAVASYLQARDEGRIVNFVAFTYPELVAEYKQQGDSVFQQKFNCQDYEVYPLHIEDPTMRETAKENENIHVLYELEAYDKQTREHQDEKFKLVALSTDNGRSWFFMDYDRYVDKSCCPKLKRLLN